MSADADQNGLLLLYEDDHALAREIVVAFAAEGLTVEPVLSEAELLALAKHGGVSALILDRMVEGTDSLALMDKLRDGGERMPVIVISSLASVDDRIHGLKAGGDDYLVKPFAMGELIARVEALRRRTKDGRKTSLVAGPLVMDLIARTVRRGPREIALLPREFSLLEYLMRHAGQVVTRAMLLEDVWNFRMSTHTNVVDVHIGNLRRKVEAEGEERLILSVRGLGFKLLGEPSGPA